MSEKRKLDPLIKTLVEWINSELADNRVIVKDLGEDLHDGQILQMLVEKLSGLKSGGAVNGHSFTGKLHLGESSQKQNLTHVLELLEALMTSDGVPLPALRKWTMEDVYEKDIIAILHLLVAMCRYFKVPVVLPENITVRVIIIQVSLSVYSIQC
jgi:parvin